MVDGSMNLTYLFAARALPHIESLYNIIISLYDLCQYTRNPMVMDAANDILTEHGYNIIRKD